MSSPATNPLADYLTVAECATGPLTRGQIIGAIHRGELQAVYRGRRWLIHRDWLAAWLTPADGEPVIAPAHADRGRGPLRGANTGRVVPIRELIASRQTGVGA